MNSIRLLLADDHPLFLDGLRMALSDDASIEIAATVGDGEAALEKIRELQPQVALIDLDMPGLNGVELARRLERDGIDCALIIVSMHRNPALIRAAVDAGIAGYLLKDSAAREIVEAVREVARGGNYFSPAISSVLLERRRKAAPSGVAALTDAERKVLRLIASDRTSKEIADDLGLSIRTIENHRSRAARKLGLSGAHSLVKFAFEHREEL